MLYKKPLLLALIGLASLFLTACAAPSAIKEYIYVRDAVPSALLADCPGYAGPLVDNGDLAQAYITERQALARCNADKEALRKWEADRDLSATGNK